MCLCVCWVRRCPKKGASDSLELELQVVAVLSHLMWVMRAKLRYPAGEAVRVGSPLQDSFADCCWKILEVLAEDDTAGL